MTARTRLATLACLPFLAIGLLGLSPDEPNLEQVMKGLKNNLQTVGRAVADKANNKQVLTALDEMEVLALAGKRATPPRLEVPDERWEAHVTAFHADMARLVIALAEMEIDVLEGRNDEAAAAVKDVLIALRNSSHDKYK